MAFKTLGMDGLENEKSEKMKHPKVSIIVAVYNAAKTLSRLVDSLLIQTMHDFEVIFVDDGSTDESACMCENYCNSDSRCRVIHKQNSGVSAARQTGIETARGEYIIHADADDWVEANMLEEMLVAIGNKDVLITDFYSETGRTNIVCQQPTDVENNYQLILDLFNSIHGNCWSKLVRTDIVRKYNLQFYFGIDFCEDLLFWVQAFSYNDIKVAYLNKPFYHYYCPVTHDSLCSAYSKKYVIFGHKIVERLEKILPIEIKNNILRDYKLRIKYGALEHPIYTQKEYDEIFPDVNRYVMRFPTSLINRFCFYLSVHGMYGIATSVYRAKNKITSNHIR